MVSDDGGLSGTIALYPTLIAVDPDARRGGPYPKPTPTGDPVGVGSSKGLLLSWHHPAGWVVSSGAFLSSVLSSPARLTPGGSQCRGRGAANVAPFLGGEFGWGRSGFLGQTEKMNHYCCVPQCSSWVKRNPELSFHTFPKAGKSKVIVETKLGNKELVDRREMWIRKLRIGKKKRVKRRTLKSQAIPSQKLPVVSNESQPGPSRSRISRRSVAGGTSSSSSQLETANVQEELCENVVEEQEDREAAEALLTLLNSYNIPVETHANPSTKDFAVQVNTPKVLTLCELITTDEKLKNFTGPLIYFPSKNEVLKNMPICFSEFQDVRVVLDCTEIFVQSPKCLCCRIRFYSQYKSHMTVKFMTGVSPGGLITYVSKPYGGRASDKVIFEESNIIAKLDPGRDAVMVDKGFRIEDTCSIFGQTEKMNHYCCVPQCSSWVKRNPELSFHTFPKAGKSKVIVETKLGNKELVDRREMWIRKLRIGKKKRVKRRTLKSQAIPSQKLPVVSNESQLGPSRSRISRRSVAGGTSSSSSQLETANVQEELCENVVEEQEDREAAEALLTLLNSYNIPVETHANPSTKDFAVQVNTPKVLTLCELITTDEKLKNFTDVRVVLDCTEIFVQSPKCLCCRIRFYSQYKSHMTVKFMTGVSPGGLITYVSKPYGGRASDKVIFEESNIIAKLDPGRDAVMVDKGFRIEDTCSVNKIKLIRPPFLQKKSQLTTEESILNAKIASARIHIERSNQRGD
ncbi:hypothetical protein NQ315_005972 [Exocentrus adspersus]|uniref:THAP-type domain-containing protein n=1 Tax=Exocentrus adspersus TaxID=1586481 RepID=A0AAV8V7P0_9CUCU|nr:hypothetical protein NQ315_005972 [Exocentrus adspersus]